MNIKDRRWLQSWARSGATLAGAEVPRIGLVENERFSARAQRLAVTLAHFAGFRFSSARQERFYTTLGKDATDRRIARVQRVIEALKRGA